MFCPTEVKPVKFENRAYSRSPQTPPRKRSDYRAPKYAKSTALLNVPPPTRDRTIDASGILALRRISSGVPVRVLSVVLGLRVLLVRHHGWRVVVVVVQVSRGQTSGTKTAAIQRRTRVRDWTYDDNRPNVYADGSTEKRYASY